MDSIESQDRLQKILKYGKYLFLLMIIVGVFLLFRSCGRTYSDIENDVIEAAKKYISQNNIVVNGETYIEITKLNEVEGTELCSKASGVVVKNTNGKLTYQAYLDCLDYQSPLVKTNNKYIVLNGDSVVVLNKGEVFNDPMYTLKKEADVVVSGKANTTPGIYSISYMAYVDNELKETVYRKVIVTENDKDSNVSGLKNTQEPTITLYGDKNIILSLGSRYKEPGYSAVDYEDGKISRKVEVNGSVNTSSVGTYSITYSVTNSKGKSAVEMRKVTVVKEKANLEIELTSDNENIGKTATITGTISGQGYNYTLLPNGNRQVSNSFTYGVNDNRIYTFKVYDVYGNEYLKEIEITNIDNKAPTGTCEALVRGNNTEVEVNASDNKGIAGYSYILDGKEKSYITTNTYKVSSASKTVVVNIKDIVGNVATINCNVTVKEETTVPGRVSGSAHVIDTSEYKLVATRNDVVTFAKAVDSLNVGQNHPPGYGDLCLSFAYYHAYKLYNGDSPSSMSAEAASKYQYASKFKGYTSENKQDVLAQIYESINAGQPCILHVNGNKAGTSRHYVAVVGYKNSVTSASSITEEDLLIIDSYDGKLERMDTTSSRFMITGHDTGRTGSKAYGWQVYIFR